MQPEQLNQINLPSFRTVSPVLILTTGTSTLTANPSSAFIFGSQTLVEGGQITYSGTTYSLAVNGASLVVDGTSTQVLKPAFIVASQTLIAGGQITVEGTTYSLASDGGALIVNGTQAIGRSSSYGHGNPTAAGGTNGTTFLGRGHRMSGKVSLLIMGYGLGMSWCVFSFG